MNSPASFALFLALGAGILRAKERLLAFGERALRQRHC